MKSIRPVSFEECIGVFRVVTDAEAMGATLLKHGDKDSESFEDAARACMALLKGEGDPDTARDTFVRALLEAGVFVKGD